ncbi:hypothetical protein QOZ80_1BG0073050 [Eleusine coracana subsp. coracana]|nr:hypothetical protein QOZ80_1BG0073050 [Eleusine coracana subsp. coracana]
MALEELALLGRPLLRAFRDTVPLIVDVLHVQAHRRLAGDIVVAVGEVLKVRQVADALRHVADEPVMREVKLLDAAQISQLLRNLAHEAVEAEVQHGESGEHPELSGHAGLEPRVEEEDLVERVGHVGDGGREAPAKVIVGEHKHGYRRVPHVVGDPELEPVGVEEDGVELAVEELAGDGTLELVVAEVEVPQRRHLQHGVREPAHEAVVAEVELVEQVEVGEGARDQAAEAVGVEVQDGQVRAQQAQLVGEVARQVGVVEVDGGHHGEVGVGGGGRAEDAVVGAHVGTPPGARHVVGVREDGALPRLQRDVRVAEPRVRERVRRVHLVTATAAIAVLEELPAADVSLVVRAQAAAHERRRGEELRGEEEREEEEWEEGAVRRHYCGARIGPCAVAGGERQGRRAEED